MKLSEIKTEKAGSAAGTVALRIFFDEVLRDVGLNTDFQVWLTSHTGGVEGESADLYLHVVENASGYTVRVAVEAELGDFVIGETTPSGSEYEADSPTKMDVVFSLPAHAAIEVAVGDEDELQETFEKIQDMAGGFVTKITQTFGQTNEYKEQARDLRDESY